MFAYSMREKTNAHRTLEYVPTFYILLKNYYSFNYLILIK
jgi:hypothetical protein